MQTALLICILLCALLTLLLIVLKRDSTRDFKSDFEPLLKGQERTERLLLEELSKAREETARNARSTREEMDDRLSKFGAELRSQLVDIATLQKNHLDSFERQLTTLREGTGQKLDGFRTENTAQAQKHREEIGAGLRTFTETQRQAMAENANQQKEQLGAIVAQVSKLGETVEQRLETVRSLIDAKLKHIQEDNQKQLEQMRATVDEKLQGTLEKRLGESFKLVSDRLEAVHRGLGEMQNLAVGVGDLKKLLGNVKTRGGWGEIQLGALLEQVLTPDQFQKNVRTRESSGQTVEFAIKLPGKNNQNENPVWIPIDAKFPIEDYQRLVAAQEAGNIEEAEAAGKFLETRIRKSASDICEKYINPPVTTDFAIMFLPTEGLYAEVIRRIGLVEILQRECRVVVTGPTTLAALLNSLQMGFRTLAIEKRSSEVWELLGAVKTEFGKFGGVLESVKKKLDQASNTMSDAALRSRQIEKRLRDVQTLPEAQVQTFLPEIADPLIEEELPLPETKIRA